MKKALGVMKILAMLTLFVVACYGLNARQQNKKQIDYFEHLDDVVVTVDGEEVTMRDLGLYILYVERNVEEEAMVYNRKSTKDFWNIHTNDTFIQLQAKESILEMAIHDRLFYQLASEAGMELSAEDEEYLACATIDFWEDLLDCQKYRLPADEETINQQLRLATLAEKHQNNLAETKGPTVAAYKYDGYEYKLIREQHEIVINDKLWDRFVVGDVTLVHNRINYINGYNREDETEE
ncbi:MAG: hypothetical protein HUJ98_12020 [Bacteroidaceae bacterium]|nr:hypothetical protein [Bacteroidaceae bacterium]